MAVTLESRMEAPRVLIVGCGIGGAVLAAVLSRAGISSLILEREVAPLDRFRGEIIQPYGVSILAALGFLEHIRAEGFGYVRTFHGVFPCAETVTQINRRVAAATPIADYAATCPHQRLYAALRRRILDDPGIELQSGSRVMAVEQRRYGGWDVTVMRHGRRRQFRAPIVVGADGAQSLVSQSGCFQTAWDSTRTYLLGAVVESRSADMETFVFIAEADWVVYLFPLGNSRARITMEVNADFLDANRGRLEDSARVRICSRTLHRFGYPLDGARTVSPVKVVGCPNVRSEYCLVDGAGLVGDALGTVDPITGHGMTIACDDALHLAAGIQTCLRERHKASRHAESRRWPKGRYRCLVERFSDLLVHGCLEQSPSARGHRPEVAAWFAQRAVAGSGFLQELAEIDAAIHDYLSQQATMTFARCGSPAGAL